MALSVFDFQYKEFDDNGELLDREDGAIPGIVFGFGRRTGPWELSGTVSYHAGNVTYDGQTQTGIPVTTRTDEQITQLEGRAEYWPSAASRWVLYGGLGYRSWVRDIQPTHTAAGAPVSGLYELYDWWYGFLGGKAFVYGGKTSHWLVDIQLQRILDAGLRVDPPDPFDRINLDLGDRSGVRVSLPWSYQVDHITTLSIEPYVERWKFGRSPTVPLTAGGVSAGQAFEPYSETRNVGLTVGMSRRF